MLNQVLEVVGLGSWTHEWLTDPSVAMYSLYFVALWQYLGYHTLIQYTGILNVPEEIYEAARIDGADGFAADRYITFPNIIPIFKISIVLAFIGSLQAFDMVMVMTGGTRARNRRHFDPYVQHVLPVHEIRVRQLDCGMFGRALPCGHLPDQSDIQQAGETLFVKEENAMNTSSAVTLNKPAAAARRGRFSVAKTIVILFLSILVVTQVYPLLWLVLYSLKTNEEILSGSFFALPHAPQWSNYSAALEGNYFRYLLNSLFVTSVTMAAVILLSSLCAYAISRFRWRYGQGVMLLFLIGMMIPMQATLLPLMIIFKNMHVLNTHLSLILPYVAFSMPIAVFILSGFMKTIPHEIEESAVIDGPASGAFSAASYCRCPFRPS